MDATSATVAGLTCGFAIAIQVGPVSLLLIEAAVAGGRRAGVAGGMGVATADFTFAGVAAATGGAAGAALASHAGEIRIAAALVLAAIAVAGLAGMRGRAHSGKAPGGGTAGALDGGPDARRQYTRFLGITMANPLTIASFAAVAAALSLDGPVAAVGFVAGVGLASAAWHVVLGSAAGHAGRWMTARVRDWLAIAGRLAVLALAAHLALTS
jgi:threonine/homoserine/homoserine lactone efflux protein